MADDSIMNLPAEMVGHYNQQEAAALVEGLRAGQDPAFDEAYLHSGHPEHSRAKAIWEKLHSTAFPPQELADKTASRFERNPATDTNGIQAARTEIKRLQRDSDFVRQFTEGNAEAKAKWARLHEEAYPGDIADGDMSSSSDEAAATEALGDDRQIDASLPLRYGEDMSLGDIREFNAMATEDIATLEQLGHHRDVSVANIGLINQSRELRGDREWNAVELATFDSLLRDKWGSEYEAKQAHVRAVAKRMKSAEHLAWNLDRVEPHLAVHILDQLAQSKIQ